MSSNPRVIIAASTFVTALALVACGAPPDSQGNGQQQDSTQTAAAHEGKAPSTDSTQVAVGAATTANSGSDGDAGAGGPALECNTLKRDACVTCCNVAYPQMANGFRQTLAQCVCLDPGECRTECGPNYCSGAAATPACAACISNSTVCGPATLTVCKSAPACSAYLTCLDSCGK